MRDPGELLGGVLIRPLPSIKSNRELPFGLPEVGCMWIVVDIKHYDTFLKCVKIKFRT